MGKLKDDFTKVTEVELVYRNKIRALDRPQISSSLDAYKLFEQIWDENKIELQEQFKVMLLDNRNACLGITNISSGGINYCPVDAKLVFAAALKARATGLILAHNHPTGQLKFSSQDKALTSNFNEVAKILGIAILDHLVLTKEGYVSLSDIGELPSISRNL